MQEALARHLAWWGLRAFDSDQAYFQWQRQALSPADLSDLHRNIEHKRRGSPEDEVAFYDATARSTILPVLYSQRCDYYRTVGACVAERIGSAGTVLDFGCGVGILTTFYARHYPDTKFVGIDRSAGSITEAQARAKALGLANIRFECVDVTQQALSGVYDCVVATHALVQAEQDPGLPSRDWTTFERSSDPVLQQAFEERTGIGARLDRLSAALAPNGRLIVCEKTRQLARRVPFQRALAGRGFRLVEPPEPVRYRLVGEIADDGPFYVVQRHAQTAIVWDERPEPDEGPAFDQAGLPARSSTPDEPLYENHCPSAQRTWEQFNGRTVIQETTRHETDGRQLHAELGLAQGYAYLYCANTFDQRQFVVMPAEQRNALEAYYREILASS